MSDYEGEQRFIASEWHGGQSSALYALSSTGTVVPGLWAEVNSCLKALDAGQYSEEEQEMERPRLEYLLAWADEHEKGEGQ